MKRSRVRITVYVPPELDRLTRANAAAKGHSLSTWWERAALMALPKAQRDAMGSANWHERFPGSPHNPKAP
jgi:hypothetical protein